jgi:hypothetical protein
MNPVLGKKNFVKAHWDWLLAAFSAACLAGGVVFLYGTGGTDPEEAAAEASAEALRRTSSESGVKEADLLVFSAATRAVRKPMTVDIPEEGKESFLASERRVKCVKQECERAIQFGSETCPFCNASQVSDKKVVYDADADGLPDEWEKKFGLNISNANDASSDLDGDGFTNIEEFKAKTDPSDKSSHPDYLDSLKVIAPLDETYLPFVFKKANKIPSGWRLEFFDPKKKNDYGLIGKTMTAKVGEEIEKTGYKAISYTPKTIKQIISGTGNLTKPVDVSEAVVERVSDGKRVTLVIQQGKTYKFAPVDVQATVTYERGNAFTRKVIVGETINLNGSIYKILSIKPEGKGAKVTFENASSGAKKTLSTLE